ncbi:MAG: TolC family protein, partial [Polaribacter sp.]|nr:TolC family protein [Polaribacter sp.]
MRISLNEAIDFAIENSYNTKASKNGISSAKETVRETSATGLPQINA